MGVTVRYIYTHAHAHTQVSHSSEEVLALKRFIQRSAQDQERLKEVIAQNKERDEFMYAHR